MKNGDKPGTVRKINVPGATGAAPGGAVQPPPARSSSAPGSSQAVVTSSGSPPLLLQRTGTPSPVSSVPGTAAGGDLAHGPLAAYMRSVVQRHAGQSLLRNDVLEVIDENARIAFQKGIHTPAQLEAMVISRFRHDAALTAADYVAKVVINGTANYVAFKDPNSTKNSPVIGNVTNINEKTPLGSAVAQYSLWLMAADFLASIIGETSKDNRYFIEDVNKVWKFIDPDYQANYARKVAAFMDKHAYYKNYFRVPAAALTGGAEGVTDRREGQLAQVVDNSLDSFLEFLFKLPLTGFEVIQRSLVSESYIAAFYAQKPKHFDNAIAAPDRAAENTLSQTILAKLQNSVSKGFYNMVKNAPATVITTATMMVYFHLLFNGLSNLNKNGIPELNIQGTDQFVEQHPNSPYLGDLRELPNGILPTKAFIFNRLTVATLFLGFRALTLQINEQFAPAAKTVARKVTNVVGGALTSVGGVLTSVGGVVANTVRSTANSAVGAALRVAGSSASRTDNQSNGRNRGSGGRQDTQV
jgi:hypothetical protein